jgi:hypothetical protein
LSGQIGPKRLSSGSTKMEHPITIKEVKVLETAEDIQERREQVENFLEAIILGFCFYNLRFLGSTAL